MLACFWSHTSEAHDWALISSIFAFQSGHPIGLAQACGTTPITPYFELQQISVEVGWSNSSRRVLNYHPRKIIVKHCNWHRHVHTGPTRGEALRSRPRAGPRSSNISWLDPELTGGDAGSSLQGRPGVTPVPRSTLEHLTLLRVCLIRNCLLRSCILRNCLPRSCLA